MTLPSRSSRPWLLLSLFVGAAGCPRGGADEFTEESERLQCEIGKACGFVGDDADCDGRGWEVDRCTKFYPERADDCLDALEGLLEEIEMLPDPEEAPVCEAYELPPECYDVLEYQYDRKGCDNVEGRPLHDDHGWVMAECVEGSNWSSVSPADPLTRDLAPAERDRVIEHWIDAARAEHASIAAFHRLATQLMVLAAPADLVTRAHAAAADEMRHASETLGVARRMSGRALDFGPLRWSPETDAPTLRKLALESFIDGCIGEAVAAARAWTAARHASPSLRATLQTIARDELEHACLAWSIVGWAVAEDPGVLSDLERALLRREASIRRALDAEFEPEGLPAFGVLDPELELRLELGLICGVVEPALRQLAAGLDRGFAATP